MVLLSREFGHLDPVDLQASDQGILFHLIFSYLYRLNKDAVPVPDLVESERIEKDNMTWTLTLKKGRTFHDGTPVNADAVKYSIDRMVDPERKAPQRVLFAPIKEVRVRGEHVVQLVTQNPFPALRYNLAHSNAVILSPTADRKLGKDFGRNPVGSAPTASSSGSPASASCSSATTAGRGRARTGRPSFSSRCPTRSPASCWSKGEADVAVRVNPLDTARLSANKAVRLLVAEGARNAFFQLNMTRPPTDNLKVRQALNYAVDKDAIIKVVLNGAGSPSRTVLEKPLLGSKAIGPYPYDPKEAASS